MNKKILNLEALAKSIAAKKQQNKSVLHCHGVFDLLHIGHIKHLEAAKKNGDVLVVTITPDQYVNKGPHRPAFPQQLRAEALASLSCVDYVAINQWPTAVETINLLKPDFFVKGKVEESGQRDYAQGFDKETQAIEKVGGQLLLTDEDTFSASSLINRHLNVFTPAAEEFLVKIRDQYTPEDLIEFLRSIRSLKILTVGETIIDEYQFCSVLGKVNKDPILAARHLNTEQYAGGILALSNHLAGFCDHVGLLTMLGSIDSHEEMVRGSLKENVEAQILFKTNSPTIVKRRFLETHLSAKLFEIYVMQNEDMSVEEDDRFCSELEKKLPEYDVVIVADYGHGLISEGAAEILCSKAKFLAVNSQVNAGNRGFNTISKYRRADYVSLGEPEMRLEARSHNADLRTLINHTAKQMGCKKLLVTRGSSGCLLYDHDRGIDEFPAFGINLVDRTGAGDAVLSITAPCVRNNIPSEAMGFIANVVGAEACSIMGNKSSLDPSSLYRHITSLLK